MNPPNLESKPEGRWLMMTAWTVALVATLGSLFFSEVMGFPPCSLCWYQRIAMYPLVLIYGVGIFSPSGQGFRFALAFVLLGWLMALYHNFLHWGIIPETASPCSQGLSCATVYIQWAGFISIPLLSLFAFSILLVLQFLARQGGQK